jgi:hypothetical protein
VTYRDPETREMVTQRNPYTRYAWECLEALGFAEQYTSEGDVNIFDDSGGPAPHGPEGPIGPSECNEALIELGNDLAKFSENTANASGSILLIGLGMTAVGAATVQPEIVAPGVALTATGGAGGSIAGLAQVGAGVLQGLGGAGYSNATNGVITMGGGVLASRFLRWMAGPTPNDSVTAVGGVFDAVAFLTQFGPQEKRCLRQ